MSVACDNEELKACLLQVVIAAAACVVEEEEKKRKERELYRSKSATMYEDNPSSSRDSDVTCGSHEDDEVDDIDSDEAIETDSDSGSEGDLISDDCSDEDVATTLEEVFNSKPALEAQREQPPDVEVNVEVIGLAFHPQSEVLSAATLDGEIIVYQYSLESVMEEKRLNHHSRACRAITYSDNGQSLYSVSTDQSVAVIDTETCNVGRQIKDAHDSAIYSVHSIRDHMLATGDDDGTVKLWDLRKDKAIASFKCGEETVTSFLTDAKKKTLIATLADGSIAAFNLHDKQLIRQSEMYSNELTSACLLRNGTKLVVGSTGDKMYIFNWGEFNYHADSFLGQPDSVDCMLPIGDSTVVTGCGDGIIRACHLYPHRFIGVVGQHKNFGVESISLSRDGRFLASCALDEVIRFWNIDYLYSTDVDERKKGSKRVDCQTNLESSRQRNITEFFNDLPKDSDCDSDDDKGPVNCPKNVED